MSKRIQSIFTYTYRVIKVDCHVISIESGYTRNIWESFVNSPGVDRIMLFELGR